MTSLANSDAQLNEECYEDHESAIYILQTVVVEGFATRHLFCCCDVVSKKSDVDDLQRIGRSNQEIPGTITLVDVWNQPSEAKNGIYKVRISLHDGREAVMRGIVLDNVTKAFPMYPLKGQVVRHA